MPPADFPTACDPETLTRAPCCADPACSARRLDEELATAYRAACAGVEVLRAAHARHEAHDCCPPGQCRCQLDRLVTASAQALDTARARLEWLRGLVDVERGRRFPPALDVSGPDVVDSAEEED
jgi:hypothetical protein